MGKVPKAILPIILTLVLLVTGCQPLSGPPGETSPIAQGEGTELGDLAPDFQLQNLDGEKVSLSEFRGSSVLLNFWATWCYWCRVEMPFIQEIYEERTGEPPLVVLAVNVGESASVAQNFMQSYGYSFPVLLDLRQHVAQKYNIMGYPTTFFIDKDGIIRGKRIGAFTSKESIEQYLGETLP